MYNLNSRESKFSRIKILQGLMGRVADRTLTLDDEQKIVEYLNDIKLDLHLQLFEEEIKLTNEFQTNQRKIDHARKLSRKERAELIKRNREILKMLDETKTLMKSVKESD